jgi:hypothetical protein
MLKSIVIPAFLVAILLAAPVRAQDDAPKPPSPAPAPKAEKKGPEMDALAKATLAAAKKKTFTVARQGIRKASFDLRVSIVLPTQTVAVAGHYRYENETGVLTWDEPALGAKLGSLQALFDRVFKEETDAEIYGTAKYSAKKLEDGSVKILVEGENPKHLSSLEFGADGLLKRETTSHPTAEGTKREVATEISYETIGGRTVPTRRVQKTATPQGDFVQDTKTTYAEKGDLLVPTKIHMDRTFAMQTTKVDLAFTNWKTGDEVEPPAAKKVPDEEKPAEPEQPREK